MNMQELINLVVERKNLTDAQAEAAISIIMSGEATPAQTAAFLIGLRMKGETVEEIAGCARAMRAKATRVPHHQEMVVDTCGTGGDRTGSFNISTTAAFVVAGVGVPVAKHGNRAASSKSGSADVLEALGVNLALSPEQVGRCIDEVGIGFLFAQALHGAMKFVGPVRREIATRTIFNILGPLTNPAGARAQLMGVPRLDLTEPLAGVLGRLGTRRSLVVHGLDGIDELSISGPSRVSEVNAQGAVHTYQVWPQDVGLKMSPREAILGGTPEENAHITRRVLEGHKGVPRDVVLLNAAAALLAAGAVKDLQEGVREAARAIDSGAALRRLDGLITLSRKLSA